MTLSETKGMRRKYQDADGLTQLVRKAARRQEGRAARMRRDCDAAFLDTAKRGMSRAITDEGEGQTVLTREAVFARVGDVGELHPKAFDILMGRAVDAGAVEAEGPDRWRIINHDRLCEAV